MSDTAPAAQPALAIWGRLSSINVKKVVWGAQELGLPFTRHEAGGPFGVVKTPDYLARNPNALVPLLDDGGFVLWESNAILRYLCARHSAGDGPAHLYPQDLQTRFSAERWMDWQQTTFNGAGREAFLQWVRTPAEQRSMAAIEKSRLAMQGVLHILEQTLAGSAYVAATRFTMADIPLACEIHRWWGLPHEHMGDGSHPRAHYPHVAAWYTQIQARPGARGVLDLPLS
jgi:glutathione S-transferase